jgi:hypothetical protein
LSDYENSRVIIIIQPNVLAKIYMILILIPATHFFSAIANPPHPLLAGPHQGQVGSLGGTLDQEALVGPKVMKYGLVSWKKTRTRSSPKISWKMTPGRPVPGDSSGKSVDDDRAGPDALNPGRRPVQPGEPKDEEEVF